MNYEIIITADAENDITKLRKLGKRTLMEKLNKLLNELREHPAEGTGQIEQLKHYNIPTFSRRIDKEHRLVYRISEQNCNVLIISCYGHYTAK